MQRESIWESYLMKEKEKMNWQAKTLQQDIHTDVLIVGAGIAGILCGYRLKQAGISCVLVDKGNFLEGVTRNTTAKITVQHGLIYNKIQKSYGLERAEQYYKINSSALEEYKKLSKEIPCDLNQETAYIYSLNHPEKLEQEAKIYEALSIPYVWKEQTPFPDEKAKAIGIEYQAQFNPMKLLPILAEELDIYENTQVLEIKKGKAVTDKGSIKAEQIILATHFPMVNIPGGYFIKMYQHRSYALAVLNGQKLDGMYMDENHEGFSFRNYKDYLLIGGGGHKTGTKGGGYLELQKFAWSQYPGRNIPYMWSAQDCMSLDGIPYIGYHSKSRSNVFVATGFNKWGMTGAMSAAMVLEDLIVKGKSEYENLFSPARSMMHSQVLVNLGSAIGNILRPGKRCTHMGCALRWNPQERTWDCPCHGSRFGENGTVLENPAKRNKRT